MNLVSPEVRLRAPEPEDLEVMLAFENDESIWEQSSATGPYSRYQLKRFLSESQNDLFVDRQLRLMLTLPDGHVAGIVDLSSFDPRHNRAEIGIVIRKEFRRKGIGKKALAMLEQHSFRLLGIHQLYALVREDNAPSIALFRSCGYEKGGCLKAWYRSGIGYKDVLVFQKLNPKATCTE